MKPRELAQNAALALATTALVLVVVEGGARLVEKRKPPRREVADYIWDWDDKMPGGFYVTKSDAAEARKTTAPFKSSGPPNRCSGMCSR